MKRIILLLLSIVLIIGVLATIKLTSIGKPFSSYNFGSNLLSSNIDTSKAIQLTFLGTSGFVINYKGKKLITDPYFSNPNIIKGTFVKMDTPPLPEQTLAKSIYADAATMVISHGHYDHCLDIQSFLSPNQTTKIICEQHIANELNAIKTNYKVEFETDMSNFHYSADSTYRILPLNSPHSPHFANITLFTGYYPEPLTHFPKKLFDWKLHNNYSYMIDIMEADEIKYRILFMSGTISDEGLATIREQCQYKKADLALNIFWKEKACMPSLMKVIDAGHPSKIILHHWNNFFVSYSKPLEVMRDTHLDKVLNELNKNGNDVKIMKPFSTISL